MNTIITEKLIEEQDRNDIISNFFKKFNIGKVLVKANFYKIKGTQPIELLKYLFTLVFTNKNIYRDITTRPQAGKRKKYNISFSELHFIRLVKAVIADCNERNRFYSATHIG